MAIKKIPENLTIISDWTDGEKICRMITIKDMVRWADDGDIKPERFGEFTFAIHNPFPCTRMRSTYKVVAEWMERNGWKKLPSPAVRYIHGYYINDSNGEKLREYEETYHYIPVR